MNNVDMIDQLNSNLKPALAVADLLSSTEGSSTLENTIEESGRLLAELLGRALDVIDTFDSERECLDSATDIEPLNS